MSFENFTDEELKAELEKRTNPTPAFPLPLAEPKFERLRALCVDYLTDLNKNGRVDDDYKYYIYEVALEAVYGKEVWKFINRVMK